jgi:hypothetical protein
MIIRSLSNTKLLLMAWRITGGWSAAWRSGDFRVSIIVTLLCFKFWSDDLWWDQVISVLPNLLGFTLGGFAIFLGFGSESFKTMLSDDDEMRSPYISVSASFLVFVLFQVMALLYAFVAKATHFNLAAAALKAKMDLPPVVIHVDNWLITLEPYASGLGYFLFVYSLIFTLRASMRIFRLSRWYHSLIVDEAEDAERRRQAETQ